MRLLTVFILVVGDYALNFAVTVQQFDATGSRGFVLSLLNDITMAVALPTATLTRPIFFNGLMLGLQKIMALRFKL